MTGLLVLLLTLLILTLVAQTLLLFQRWEDREALDCVQREVREMHTLLLVNEQRRSEDESLVGKTWVASNGEQARIEELMQNSARARQHARTGSDPFLRSAPLAP